MKRLNNWRDEFFGGGVSPSLETRKGFFKAFVDALSDAWILVISPSGRLLFMNAVAKEELLLSGINLDVSCFFDLLSPISKTKLKKAMDSISISAMIVNVLLDFEGEGNHHREVFAVVKNEVGFCLWTLSDWDFEYNLYRGYRDLFFKENLVQSYFKLLWNSSYHVIFNCSLEGKILSVSKGCQSLLGYSSQEMVGCNERSFVFYEDRAVFFKKKQDFLLKGEVAKLSCRRVSKGGQFVYLQVECDTQTSLRTKESGFLQIETQNKEDIVRTIDQFRGYLVGELFKQLQQPCAVIAEGMDSIETLAAEIRGFLPAVVTEKALTVQHLYVRQGRLFDETLQLIEILDKQSKYLHCLLEDLLLFKKLKTVGSVLAGEVKESFNLEEKLQEMLLFYKDPLENKGIQVVYAFQGCDVEVSGYPHLIFQTVFRNLISNAKRALALKDESKRLSFSTTILHSNVESILIRFIVEDNGEGIPEEKLANLIDSHFAIGEFKSSRSLGMGLYVVRGIVEEMGGSFKIESKANEYTRVIFDIPFQCQDKKSIDMFEIREAIDCKKIQLAYLCSQEAFGSLAKVLGEALNMEVFVYSKGKALVDDFKAGVVLDGYILGYRLPDMTGAEVCSRLRSGGCTAKIIGFVEMKEDVAYENFNRAKVDEVFVKPFSLNALLKSFCKD